MSTRTISLAALVLTCTVVISAACAPTYVARDAEATFTPQPQKFWDLPFPSDLRMEESGVVDLERWPGDWDSEFVKMWLLAAHNRCHGWGLSTGAFFTVSADLDETLLPTPSETLTEGAAAYIVDIDPASPEHGKRFPLEVEYRAHGDRYAPDKVLSLSPVPGFIRRSSTLYAAVVTDAIVDTNGKPLGASRAFFDALYAQSGADERATLHLAPLAKFLDEQGIDKSHVVDAAVFTTLDADKELLEVAALAESMPTPPITRPFAVIDENDDFIVMEGGTQFPVMQTGQRPYSRAGEGIFARDADGKIMVVDHQDVRITLTVPKKPMPDNGYPVTIFMHGSGGNAYEGIDLGPGVAHGGADAPRTGPALVFAQKGIAMMATDFPLHGTRNNPPDEDGMMLYNILGNVEATIDNFHVAVLEQMLMTKIADSVIIYMGERDTGDRLIHFDPDKLAAMGFSMGTSIGVPFAAVDPRVKAFIGAGAGGNMIELANSTLQPYELRPAIQSVIGMREGEELHYAHPLLHAFQTVWDLVDPVVKAKRLVVEPFDGVPAKDVFLSAGYRDGYFGPRSTTAMAIAMGTPLVGDAAEPTLPDTLALAGRDDVTFPVHADLNGKTAAVLSYAAPDMRGHYVLFDRDDARQQYTCFVQSLGGPDGTQIPAPSALAPTCEAP